MGDEKKYYKVVRVMLDGRLMSVMTQTELAVVYTPGEWTAAKVGGLFVFNNLYYARTFAGKISSTPSQLWEVEIDGLYPEEPVWTPDPYDEMFSGLVEHWWANGWPFDPTWPMLAAPMGSRAVERVKLLHKVW